MLVWMLSQCQWYDLAVRDGSQAKGHKMMGVCRELPLRCGSEACHRGPRGRPEQHKEVTI